MKIELAKYSGFCMGVRDAILKIVGEINSTEDNILVYGSLIHNPQTVNILNKRGLKTIHDLDEIDRKIIAIRTHGIEFEKLKEIKERSKTYINLTCPKVARVQGLIKKHSNEGYYIIIIGDNDHAEVTGLKSYASSGVSVISKIDYIKEIPKAEKYFVVSQTTFDADLFDIITKALNEKFENISIVNTICDSTHNRQNEVKEAVKNGIDTLVVVGGKKSANTLRLVEIGKNSNIPTYHIETESELDENIFTGIDHVLVTAGASTPGWIINRVLEKLYDIKYRNSNVIISLLKRVSEFFVRTNIFSAIAASFITLFALEIANVKPDYRLSAISFFYIFYMYTVNNYFDINFISISNPYKFKIYNKFNKFLMPLAVFSILFSIYLSAAYNRYVISILIISTIFGSIYSTRIIKSLLKAIRFNFVKKLYGSKNLISAFGWLIIATVMPLFAADASPDGIAVISLFIFCLIFLRNILLDIIAFQGDLILGRETLPILLGINKTRTISIILSIISVAIFSGHSYAGGKVIYTVFSINIIYYALLLIKIDKLSYLNSLKYELLVDLNFIIFIIFFFLLT